MTGGDVGPSEWMCVCLLRRQCLLTGVDVCPSEWTCVCPLRGQRLLIGVDVCLSEWVCVRPLRGQHLLTGVGLCCPLQVSLSCLDHTWLSLAGGPRPCAPTSTRAVVYTMWTKCRLLSEPSSMCAIRRSRYRTPASSCSVTLSTCTQGSVTGAGHRVALPRLVATLEGWARAEDAQLRAASSTVKSAVLEPPGSGPASGNRVCRVTGHVQPQSPGPDCGLGGPCRVQPHPPPWQSLGRSPQWVHQRRLQDIPAGPSDVRTHGTHRGLPPPPQRR